MQCTHQKFIIKSFRFAAAFPKSHVHGSPRYPKRVSQAVITNAPIGPSEITTEATNMATYQLPVSTSKPFTKMVMSWE